LACAGDVSGNLGFWDVNGEKEDPDEEAPQPIVYTYRPHTRTITSMMYSPSNLSQLYTSSYDGTVQYFDMEKAEFVTAFEDPESDIPFTAFDMPKDGHSVCLQGMSLHTRGQLFHSSNAFPF
jgi:WD40 repeat protein